MKKILFVLLSASFCTFTQAKTKIPEHFAGLWVHAENKTDWNTICKNPKFNLDSPENAWAVYINTQKNTMKLDGSWMSEITYFQTVNVNSDKTQITGKERSETLWIDQPGEEEDKNKLSKYQLRVNGDKLYINEFLFTEKDQPKFVFVKCKK